MSLFSRLKSQGKVVSEGQFTIDRKRQEELGIDLKKGGTIKSKAAKKDPKVLEEERLQNQEREAKYAIDQLRTNPPSIEEVLSRMPRYIFPRGENNTVIGVADLSERKGTWVQREVVWSGDSNQRPYLGWPGVRDLEPKPMKAKNVYAETRFDILILTGKGKFCHLEINARTAWKNERATISTTSMHVKAKSDITALLYMQEALSCDLEKEAEKMPEIREKIQACLL